MSSTPKQSVLRQTRTSIDNASEPTLNDSLNDETENVLSRECVNRTPTQTACAGAHSVSKHILIRLSTFHHANTRGSSWKAQDCTSLFHQNNCHPRVMSHSWPHLTLTTSTSSLSPASPIFPTVSPTHTRSLVHDPYLPCDVPRKSGGPTQIPSLTGYEPKSFEIKAIETEAIEPEDLEPRRIELDRNFGTDPYQIHERFVRSSLAEEIWRELKKLVTMCLTSSHRCIPNTIRRKALQTRILKMENCETCWLHHCICTLATGKPAALL